MTYDGPMPGKKIEVCVVGVHMDASHLRTSYVITVDHPILGKGVFHVKDVASSLTVEDEGS